MDGSEEACYRFWRTNQRFNKNKVKFLAERDEGLRNINGTILSFAREIRTELLILKLKNFPGVQLSPEAGRKEISL